MNPNTIPNKRKLAAAVDKVVRSNVLTAEDFAGACNALAQVFMDTFQVEASVKLEIKASSMSAASLIQVGDRRYYCPVCKDTHGIECPKDPLA